MGPGVAQLSWVEGQPKLRLPTPPPLSLDPPAWRQAGVGTLLTLPMLALLQARSLLARLLPPAQACSSLPCATSLPEKCHRPPGNGRQAWHQVTAQQPRSLVL